MVVVHVRAGGRGAKAQGRYGVLRRCRQVVVDARQVRATVLEAEQDAADAGAGGTIHAGGLGGFESPVNKAPGVLARGAGGHLAVPDMLVLDGADFVDVFGRVEQPGVLVGAVPGLVREVRVGRGLGHFGVLAQQAHFGVKRIARRAGGLAAAHHHRVGQFGYAALDRVGRGGFFKAAEGILERGGPGADHLDAGDRAIGGGKRGAHAQARDGQQHAGAGAQHTQFHQITTVKARTREFTLRVHGALDQLLLLLVHCCLPFLKRLLSKICFDSN